MAFLELSGVSVTFGGLRAVDDLSFSVPAGSIKGIIGPNGAGKTTLFNAISGITLPDSGRIVLDGRDVTRMRPFRRASLGMSRTFQNLQIFGDMSVLENVMVGAHTRLRSGWFGALAGLSRAEERLAEGKALDKLRLLGLDKRADDSAADLGFADAKLLEIARALASEPSVLLLDEPIAGVPPADQDRIAGVIRDVNASGVTVILVEHNMRVVMRLCSDILVMNYGARLAEGAPDVVARDPGVIAAYLGPTDLHA